MDLEYMQKHSIMTEIQNFRFGARPEVKRALNMLSDQFDDAAENDYTRAELEDLLKTENDVLDLGGIEEGSEEWGAIRNIQDSIINFFGG